MSAAAEARTPIRATGVVHSHRVRGRGEHVHRELVTDDGTRVDLTRWPRHPHRPALVTWWIDGQRHEEAHSGLLGDRAVLAASGFTLTEGLGQ